MHIKRFFQNDKGDVVIAQRPNLLISLWLVVQVVSFAVFRGKNSSVSILGNLLLFAWAYDELTRGDSPFRKVLGGVVLAGIVITTFIKW